MGEMAKAWLFPQRHWDQDVDRVGIGWLGDECVLLGPQHCLLFSISFTVLHFYFVHHAVFLLVNG